MSVGEIISRYLESFPMGFGFHPTDELLVLRYLIPKLRDEHSCLKMKMPGTDFQVDIILEVDVCQWEPSELPAKLNHPVFSVFQTDDPEWFFFSPLHKKPQNGGQFKRATNKGFWKSTGPDRKIKHRGTGEVIGTKKTLVFHEGRGPSAVRTGWIIHEYHADKRFVRDDETYVLCRLKKETGSGFPPQTNLNGMLPNPPSNQQTWLMNMDVDDSSTGTGIHLHGPPNIMTSGADRSDDTTNIACDIGNYQLDDMTSEEYARLYRPFSDDLGFDLGYALPDRHSFDYLSCYSDHLWDIRAAVDSGNQGNCFIGRLLTCPQTPLKGAHGKGGGSSSDTDTQVAQVEAKVCNGKGSFNFPDTASAGHEPSSSPGYLVNLLVGILLLVILIAVMVQDIRAKF